MAKRAGKPSTTTQARASADGGKKEAAVQTDPLTAVSEIVGLVGVVRGMT